MKGIISGIIVVIAQSISFTATGGPAAIVSIVIATTV
jgi:hypothetical protein